VSIRPEVLLASTRWQIGVVKSNKSLYCEFVYGDSAIFLLSVSAQALAGRRLSLFGISCARYCVY